MSAPPGRDAEVAGFFDAFAEEYDRAYERNTVGGRVLRQRLEMVLELLGAGPGEVLDAGMGGGVLCEHLDRRGWAVSGVDISPAMVELARARLPHLGERLGHGSIQALPYGEARFDAAVCTGVLEYVEDALPQAVAEVARVVRPGGAIVASLPNYGSIQGIWRFRVFYPSVRRAKRMLRLTPPPSRKILTLGHLEAALAASGISVVGVETVAVRLLPGPLAARLERSRSRLARLFGTQFVVLGRKGRA